MDINEIQKEQKILKKFNSSSNIRKDLEELKRKFPTSLITNIFGRYFKLILPYYNFLEDKNLANEILKSQIDEILNKFNTIYDKIGIKYKSR